ncbi:transcriptional regulator domain-containing protein [Roseomonas fluvialis]|uniref:Transcriptional regulator-like domain-containing protein n=1 Tax=Roseomonas fluvialis TaxID=1750527 RepID=A0ABM7Y8P8_9PROT|nr:DUF6499 domain-containing protein [Roseomonas fluvialis]BDG74401.1 hypothetical protein Rmf_43300 [Roseomonas fluvialis]
MRSALSWSLAMPSRDWRSAAAYAELENASARDLAWEFLRRNPRYVRDWEQLDDTRPDDMADAVAERWGLRFPRRPGAQRAHRGRRLDAGALHRHRGALGLAAVLLATLSGCPAAYELAAPGE